MRILAKQTGYCQNHRLRKGKVYEIPDDTPFSEKWMVRVGPEVRDLDPTKPNMFGPAQDRIREEASRKIAGEEI